MVNSRTSVQTQYDYKRFFELSGDLLVIAGADGFIHKANPAVLALLGYTEAELYSRPMNEFIHPDDREITSLRRARLLERRIPVHGFENRYITAQGKVVWLSWTSIPVPDERLVFAVAKNITARKEHELERNALLEKVVRDNQELKQLSYATSHDIRMPVNNLLAAFEVLDALEIADQEARLMLDVLKQTAQQLKSTLETYLDEVNKRLAGHDDQESVPLDELLNRITEGMAQLLLSSGGQVDLDFGSEVKIWGNAMQLHSIFLNLLSNAIKYAREGVPPHIQIRAWREEAFWNIAVSDNGIGFEVADAERLFKLNDRLQQTGEGKGVGLYLVRTLVERMGGNISAHGQPGEGSIFVLQLPATPGSLT